MINKKNLLQFYVEQYAEEGKKKPKKPPRSSDIARKSENLRKTLKNAKPSRVNVRTLEELHRQVKTIAGHAHRKKQENLIKLVNEEFLPKLMELDLGNFNTANVNNMGGMFAQCENLVRLDLSSFRTPKLTQMIYMFDGCSRLTELDVSNFDTSKVVDMGYLFRNCYALAELDLSHFDTGSIAYPSYKMFENCPAGREWKHLKK